MSGATSYPESSTPLLSDAQKKQLYVGQPTAVYNTSPTTYETLYSPPEGYYAVLTNIYVFVEEDATKSEHFFHMMLRDSSPSQDVFIVRSFEIPRLNAIRIDTNIIVGSGDTIHAGGVYDNNTATGNENQINLILTGKEFPL